MFELEGGRRRGDEKRRELGCNCGNKVETNRPVSDVTANPQARFG